MGGLQPTKGDTVVHLEEARGACPLCPSAINSALFQGSWCPEKRAPLLLQDALLLFVVRRPCSFLSFLRERGGQRPFWVCFSENPKAAPMFSGYRAATSPLDSWLRCTYRHGASLPVAQCPSDGCTSAWTRSKALHAVWRVALGCVPTRPCWGTSFIRFRQDQHGQRSDGCEFSLIDGTTRRNGCWLHTFTRGFMMSTERV